MLISMTPNDEVKTIHASLNDGSLRKWEFEPYTEQGKIGLTDQDYATIQSIKGNTVKFNQLVNINISSPYISLVNGIINLTGTPSGTIGVSTVAIKHDPNHKYFLFAKTLANPNNVSFTLGVGQGQPWVADAGIVGDHSKIYQSSYQTQLNLYDVANKDLTGIKFICMTFDLTAMEIDNLTTVEQVETWLSTHIGDLPYYDYTPGSLISFNGTGLKTTGKNLCDITKMCYAGVYNDITSSFNNQTFLLQGKTTSSGGYYLGSLNNSMLFRKGTYAFSMIANGDWGTGSLKEVRLRKKSGQSIIVSLFAGSSEEATFTLDEDTEIFIAVNSGANVEANINVNVSIKLQIELGSTATEYEPYTSNTLSLPISTYFPTGMKEAGTVYDEISDKAYTRVGSVDLGTLNYVLEGDIFRLTTNIGAKLTTDTSTVANIICSKYKTVSQSDMGITGTDQCVAGLNWGYGIRIKDTSYTDVETFKQAMSGVMLFFELATPTSQDISLDLTYPVYRGGTEQILPVNGSTPTTSPMVATIEYPDRTEDVDFLYKQTSFDSAIPQFSLVCKNQELPMTLEDGKLICECDSSITSESGFFDAKVKMQDLDSVAYSQKIQLHVERGIND